jgi:hypothetical protein
VQIVEEVCEGVAVQRNGNDVILRCQQELENMTCLLIHYGFDITLEVTFHDLAWSHWQVCTDVCVIILTTPFAERICVYGFRYHDSVALPDVNIIRNG